MSLRITLYTLFLLLAIAATPLVYLLLTHDFPGASLFYGIEEDEPIVGGLLTLSSQMGMR